MKLVATIKLLLSPKQEPFLRQTLEATNRACNWLSGQAWTSGTFGKYTLQRACYQQLRSEFGLSAQMACLCVAKVANAYRPDKRTRRHFRPRAAQPYDSRIFSFKRDANAVSIWVVDKGDGASGRIVVPFACGEHQRGLLKNRKGEVDLMLVRGEWYVSCTCEVAEAEPMQPVDVLGVDLGIVNLAVDSDGDCHSGERVEHHRRRHSHRRRNLQRKGTRSAKRKLQKIKGRQQRFQKDTNHCISKALVAKAQRTASAIALEDIKGIRKRVTARRRQRARQSNWGFHQLRGFVEYKARRGGVPVLLVDPRNTSRTCPACGDVRKSNRRTRDEFVCGACGLAGPADHVAARNIRARALVNEPMVAARATSVTLHS